MAESNPFQIFGNHDIRFYNLTDGTNAAYYRVTGGVTIDMPAEFAELRGGSNLFVWRSAVKSFSAAVSIVGRQISADILSTNLSASVTETAASATGSVTDLGNIGSGTTVFSAVTGIASIAVTADKHADLKEGWYMALSTDATHVDLYSYSSATFNTGEDESYEDDDGKITAAPLELTNDGTTAVTNFGITMTGGSAVAMTPGESAIFYVVKPHGGRFSADIGVLPMTFNEYGCVISSESDSGLFYNIRLYRVKPAGMSLPFPEKDYGEFNVNMAIMHDSTENKVGTFRCSTPE